MARLTRLMLVVGSVVGFSSAVPNTSQAGVIPWIYDAIFGPVGSMRYGAGYGTYGGYGNSGYSNYGLAYSGYTPTTVAYAPTTAYNYGGGSCNSCGGGSCNSCNSTNYGTTSYVPYGGSSSCNNCSVGGSFGGSSQTTSYPAPDPNSISRDVLNRLEELEHNQRQMLNFMRKHHKEDFEYESYRQSTYKGNGNPNSLETTIPPRKKVKGSFGAGADPNTDKFEEPFRGRNSEEQEGRKPELQINPPPTGEEEKTDKSDKAEKVQSAQPKEAEPQSLRLDRKITTRAIAPKERLANNVAPQPKAPAVAKSSVKKSKAWLDSSNASEVARH